jgi:hypothetical protein
VRRLTRRCVAVAITLVALVAPACSEREASVESTPVAGTVGEPDAQSAVPGEALVPDLGTMIEREQRLQAVFRDIKPGT